MFAFITVMFSQVKVIVVIVALIGGTTMAVVVDNVVSPRAQGSQHSGSDDEDEHGSPREELLAEFAEECGPDAVLTEAELAALDAMTEDQLEAFFEPLIEACEEANEVPDPNLPPCRDEDEDDDEDDDGEDESESGGDT